MASRRLTILLKDQIKDNIELDVKKTMIESVPGKELQQMHDFIWGGGALQWENYLMGFIFGVY